MLALALGAQEASAQLRDVRYCEVIAAKFSPVGLVADVWATAGLNLCPQAEFEALNATAIARELGAVTVLLNGPRYWTLDFIVGTPSTRVRTFGNLDMRFAATVPVPRGGPPPPYSENSVSRDTQFFFFAGSEVYELIDPEGRVYVMQSYSHQVDDTLTIGDLPALGGRLQLPEGWRFRSRVVAADFIVEDVDGIATVVQDELRNSYQLVVPTPVAIDVLPFSDRNTIVAEERFGIWVAVPGSETLDATQIDRSSLAFGPDGAEPLWAFVLDMNRDGEKDLLARFRYGGTGLALGEGAACLSGELDGAEFLGCDSVTVVMPGCGEGYELAVLPPAFVWLRRRRRSRAG